MARLLFANAAVATVAIPLAPAGTSITVEAGKGALFPNPTGGDYFKLVLEDRRVNPVRREIVHCTARATDTLTISRAQEGTTAQNFNGGFVAANRMTAAAMQALVDAAGDFSGLWLGVHDSDPTVDNDGQPLQVGALYFNSVTLLNYAWDGALWRAQLTPAPGVALRLSYLATGGQVNFGSAPDLDGGTLTLNPASPVPVLAFKNGALLFRGDYTVNYAANRIQLTVPAALNDKVELQQLSLPVTLGVVDARKLRNIDLDPGTSAPGYINGARATFKIRDVSNNPVTPDSTLSLVVYLDGVPQEPGVAYTVATDEITFDENLPSGTVFWGTYYASMVA